MSQQRQQKEQHDALVEKVAGLKRRRQEVYEQSGRIEQETYDTTIARLEVAKKQVVEKESLTKGFTVSLDAVKTFQTKSLECQTIISQLKQTAAEKQTALDSRRASHATLLTRFQGRNIEDDKTVLKPVLKN